MIFGGFLHESIANRFQKLVVGQMGPKRQLQNKISIDAKNASRTGGKKWTTLWNALYLPDFIRCRKGGSSKFLTPPLWPRLSGPPRTTKKRPSQAKNLGTPFLHTKIFPRAFSFSSEDPPKKIGDDVWGGGRPSNRNPILVAMNYIFSW